MYVKYGIAPDAVYEDSYAYRQCFVIKLVFRPFFAREWLQILCAVRTGSAKLVSIS